MNREVIKAFIVMGLQFLATFADIVIKKSSEKEEKPHDQTRDPEHD